MKYLKKLLESNSREVVLSEESESYLNQDGSTNWKVVAEVLADYLHNTFSDNAIWDESNHLPDGSKNWHFIARSLANHIRDVYLDDIPTAKVSHAMRLCGISFHEEEFN